MDLNNDPAILNSSEKKKDQQVDGEENEAEAAPISFSEYIMQDKAIQDF